MPDKNGRHTVGDRDPAGEKALKDAIAGKPTPPVKAAPLSPAKKKQRERRFGPQGKTLDEVVNEAVSGANKSNPEY